MESHDSQPIPVSSVQVEDGAKELVRSEKMKPYLDLLKAQIGGQDPEPFLAVLSALPLEDRYAWRVRSALKWAFCDLETENLLADLATLSVADRKTLLEPLQLRALQFSIFILTMVGEEAGEPLMLQALRGARVSMGSHPGQ